MQGEEGGGGVAGASYDWMFSPYDAYDATGPGPSRVSE